MAKQIFKVDIDLEKNQLLQARVQNAGTAPASPVVGQIYYDTGIDKMGVYTATGGPGGTPGWLYFAMAGGGSSGYVTDVVGLNTAAITTSLNTSSGVVSLTIANATTTVDGLMSSSDKTKLDNATSSNTNNTLVERDGSGVISVSQITITDAPSAPTDAATKGYVDGLVQGLKTKLPAKAVATTNITLTGPQTIDGYLTTSGDRILVIGQTNPVDNGIYIAQGGTTAWTRAVDLDTGDSAANTYLFIEEGTTNADTGWVCTTNSPNDIVGTDGLAFVKFSSAGVIEAGQGLSKTGNVINVNAGDDSVTIGVNDIAVNRNSAGGIGLTAAGIGITAYHGITVNSNGVSVNALTNGGINVASGGISVIGDGANGITVGTNGVAVKRDPNGGIGVSANGILVTPKTNGGITVDNTGVSVKADASRATSVTSNGVGVNVEGTDVVISGNQIALGSRVTKTVYKDVSLTAGTAATITHNLNTKNVNVTVINQADGEQYFMNITHPTVNTVAVTSNSAESVRVIISGAVGASV